jgi:hypothetical protein
MRLSVRETDPGHRNWRPSMAGQVHVFVDGTVVDKVITVDEEEGYVLRFKTDEFGNVLINADRTEALTEELRGEVHFVIGDLE